MEIIFIWNTGKSLISEAALPSATSDSERERILRINDRTERRRRIGAQLLLHTILDRLHGISNPELRRDQWGRPFLADHPELSLAVSHSREFIMCGTGVNREGIGLGVDIEGPLTCSISAPGMFLAPAESNSIQKIPVVEQTEILTRLWVCKESYLKALGFGFSRSPADIAFDVDLLHTTCAAKIDESPYSMPVTFILGKTETCSYAVCQAAGRPVPVIRQINSISGVVF